MQKGRFYPLKSHCASTHRLSAYTLNLFVLDIAATSLFRPHHDMSLYGFQELLWRQRTGHDVEKMHARPHGLLLAGNTVSENDARKVSFGIDGYRAVRSTRVADGGRGKSRSGPDRER